MIWSADCDPGTIEIAALPVSCADPDAVDPRWFDGWLSLVAGPCGREHAVISDGRHRVRLDVVSGSLRSGAVTLHYRLAGTASLQPRMLPLRRLLALCMHRRFVTSLFPPDPRIRRWVDCLRVHDGLRDGASLQEIAQVMFGAERVAHDHERGSQSLRSRVRRMAPQARALAAGGYRMLMRK